MSVDIHHGDCLDVMARLAADGVLVDAVVTDPPYGLKFMGKGWDHGVPGAPYWRLALRLLKPGGHLIAFGGTRTHHRLACAIEDAGFEIRDMIAWLYGSGFPKSHDVSKAIDKGAPRADLFGGFAMHFAHCRKASGKTQKQVAQHFRSKTGGITGCVWNWENGANVPTPTQWKILQPMLDLSDEWLTLIERVEAEREVLGSHEGDMGGLGGSRLGQHGGDITAPATPEAAQWQGWGTALKPALEPLVLARKPLSGTVAANVLEHGTGALNVDGCRVHAEDAKGSEYKVRRFAPGASVVKDGNWKQDVEYVGKTKPGRWPANVVHDGGDEVLEAFAAFGDGKGAAAAVTGSEPSMAVRTDGRVYNSRMRRPSPFHADTGTAARFFYSAKADAADRLGSKHPTVKPVDLMRWLVRLVTPPGGIVLDPFAGSGTTGMACMAEGLGAVLIEREAGYVADIKRRIAHVSGGGTPLFEEAAR